MTESHRPVTSGKPPWWQVTRTARQAFWMGVLLTCIVALELVVAIIDLAEPAWAWWLMCAMLAVLAGLHLHAFVRLRRVNISGGGQVRS